MEFLPMEIKDKIFNYLTTAFLEDCISEFSEEWASIVTKIVDKRVENMLATISNENLVEIRSRLHPSVQNENVHVLREFEKANLQSKFGILSQECWRETGTELNDRAGELIQKLRTVRGCDCADVDLCLVRSIHFMPCHKLMLVQLPERIAFYSVSDLYSVEEQQSVPCDVAEYTVSVSGSILPKNIWIDNNTHTAVSVFRNHVVGQETTRVLILFKVLEADHSSRTVLLENVRRIFLPLWSCAVLMVEDKVCTLFTTGSVGMWTKSEDDISLSGNTCASIDTLRTMRLSRMYTIGDLVLVKIISDGDLPISWSIFDSKSTEENFTLYPILFKDLITSDNFLEDGELCIEVLDIFVSMNAFAVYVTVGNSANEDSSRCNFNKLIVKRIMKIPTLDSFITPSRFNEIFCGGNETRAMLSFEGSLTMPFISFINPVTSYNQQKTMNSVFSLLGLLKNNRKSQNRRKNKLRVMSIDLINL